MEWLEILMIKLTLLYYKNLFLLIFYLTTCKCISSSGISLQLQYYATLILDYLFSIIFLFYSGTTVKWNGTVSNTVKAVAIISLGKICIQSQFIARTYVSVFANALNQYSHAPIKNNAMIVLSDICTRYFNNNNICIYLLRKKNQHFMSSKLPSYSFLQDGLY